MKITEAEIRRMANFSDAGLLRYIQAAKPKIDLSKVVEKATLLAETNQKDHLAAARLNDFIESVKTLIAADE